MAVSEIQHEPISIQPTRRYQFSTGSENISSRQEKTPRIGTNG